MEIGLMLMLFEHQQQIFSRLLHGNKFFVGVMIFFKD
jgi:hypothetical protein